MKLAIIAACIAFALPASAKQICAKREAILYAANDMFDEVPAGRGVSAGMVVEILIDPDDGSWTLIETRPDGIACLVTVGQHWSFVAHDMDLGEPI